MKNRNSLLGYVLSGMLLVSGYVNAEESLEKKKLKANIVKQWNHQADISIESRHTLKPCSVASFITHVQYSFLTPPIFNADLRPSVHIHNEFLQTSFTKPVFISASSDLSWPIFNFAHCVNDSLKNNDGVSIYGKMHGTNMSLGK